MKIKATETVIKQAQNIKTDRLRPLRASVDDVKLIKSVKDSCGIKASGIKTPLRPGTDSGRATRIGTSGGVKIVTIPEFS